ncbi:cytochrome P450, partial [Lentinula lateritia]
TVFSQRTIIGNILPRIPGVSRGRHATWLEKHRLCNKNPSQPLFQITLLPRTSAVLSLVDAAAIKEVTTARARFPKPVEQYKVLSFFGDNIVASEGEDWKRYRKIAAPAFSDRNNKLIWDETIRIILDLFDNVWGSQESIVIDHALTITLPIALFVLGAAAFGRRISWKDDEGIPPNHQMSFKDAIHEVSMNCFIKVIFPDWAMGLTEHTRRVRLAFEELDSHMLEMISKRRNAEKKEERHDLLSSLLDASADDPTFTDRDLTGNIFIFLTTAHTLCFTFALLALYPDQQEILYQHIKSVLADGRLPTYEEMPLFTQSMAVFNETLRMFPPVNGIPKYSAEDTSLTVGNTTGDKLVLPVPQGTAITINTVGLHYNPRYWKDPEDFRPSRFLEPDWPRDAFLPFSAGPRACIGRKFFETEGIAILTMLISCYKIEVKEEPQFASETFEERKARVLASKPGLTITCASSVNVLITGTSLLALYVIHKYLELRRKIRSIQFLPGDRTLLARNSTIGVFLPSIPGVSKGRNAFWLGKHKPYDVVGWDATADINLMPKTKIVLTLVDAETIKEVMTSRARFPKPIKLYQPLSIFGENIVASEGEEWKRYRKIAAPAFSERNNNLIWEESLRIALDLFDNVWGSKNSIVIDHVPNLTVPFALFVLSSAAFGRRISWSDSDTIPSNHRMSFKSALHEVSLNCFTKILVPKWAMWMNEHTRKVNLAFRELEMYMLDMISEHRNAEKKEVRHDLFSNLLDASDDDPTFTDGDLISNIFIFLIAGHETTAHTLCYAFAFLALYPEQQELLFTQVKSILPDGKIPVSSSQQSMYHEMPLFTYTMAVINETLRMCPIVTGIPKYSAEDTTLTIGNISGDKLVLPVPQGTEIDINTVGLHYNPRYWQDPEEFRPARFLDPDWPRDAFVPFSAGKNTCIGRKFFETEGVAVISLLISRYKIEIKEEPQFSNETFEERTVRVLASKVGLTTTPIHVPLVFKRR